MSLHELKTPPSEGRCRICKDPTWHRDEYGPVHDCCARCEPGDTCGACEESKRINKEWMKKFGWRERKKRKG